MTDIVNEEGEPLILVRKSTIATLNKLSASLSRKFSVHGVADSADTFSGALLRLERTVNLVIEHPVAVSTEEFRQNLQQLHRELDTIHSGLDHGIRELDGSITDLGDLLSGE